MYYFFNLDNVDNSPLKLAKPYSPNQKKNPINETRKSAATVVYNHGQNNDIFKVSKVDSRDNRTTFFQ